MHMMSAEERNAASPARVEDDQYLTYECDNHHELEMQHDEPVQAIDDDETEDAISLTIHHHGKPLTFGFASPSATLSDLSTLITSNLSIPPTSQKLMITPKTGTLKPPFSNSTNLPLCDLTTKKIVLLGTSTLEASVLQSQITKLSQPRRQGPIKSATPARRTTDWRTNQATITYTFHAIKPLDYLPNPSKSTRFLEKLASDPGIKAAMTSHKFSVGLLTEMDPAMHTTHESRTLGLNRNKGQVIELRLRTDAYDGYRDYKTIRKTLCHELAHNVWGDHDRNFYNLMAEIEREVEKGDWTRGGRSVGQEEFYNPEDGGVPEGEHVDGGGWVGGAFVLGKAAAGSASASASEQGLSRRDVMAKAAEERAKRLRDDSGGN